MTVHPDWDVMYNADQPPPWDIGRPQPAFARLADHGLLSGALLDPGCGTGETALLAAAYGADVLGLDVSPTAVERARGKAAERGLTARFEVGDAANLAELAATFDTVVDSGLFHVFYDELQASYVTGLASVLRPGGCCYLLCFSDRQPGELGPRRISRDDLEASFATGWTIDDVVADTFLVNRGSGIEVAQAWLATIRRL